MKRIAIVGYGTGGQAAAVLLSADGHEVEVFEQAASPGPVGAGFLLQPIGLQVLWEIGLLAPALAHGARISRLLGHASTGRPVMDMRYGDLDERLFGLGMQRGALFELLDGAWTRQRCLHAGCRITSIEVDAGVVVDADGRRHGPYDLVVVADGSASQLRGQVARARVDRPYPWGAHWCLVAEEGWPWRGELRQRYVRARRMAGMLPVGTRPGDPTPRLSFFWSLPAEDLDPEVFDAARWRGEVAELWPETARQLRDTAVPGGLAVARYRDTVHRQWHRGRAMLLGDSAHAMSPQLGQGVNMALLDAAGLRDALRGEAGIAAALARYQQRRRAHVGIYHFWSRWLTPLFQSNGDRAAMLRDAVFHPLSRMPVGRGQMLRVLTGTRRGWLGTVPLSPTFLEALG
jgi:2-polyprenyl-6-methoxyphenol hydroxylase-like FAD-dependent oxidoreductase